MNNRNTREAFLMHWGFKKGEEAKSHKYIAREDTGKLNKRGNSIYRYFYTKESYDTFKQGVKGAQQATTGASNKKVTSGFLSGFSSAIKKLVDKGKQAVNKLLTRFGMQPYFDTVDHVDTVVSDDAPNNKNTAKEDTKKDDTKKTYKTKSGIEVTENHGGSEKYVAKIKLANGNTRYFYDDNTYNRWKKTQEYQDNEPSYMKKLKENDISPEGEIPTDDQNTLLANDPNGGPNRTVNCIYCSLAYELRSRGYDVEAVDRMSSDGPGAYSKWYEKQDGSSIVMKDTFHTVKFSDGSIADVADLENNDHVVTYKPVTQKDAAKAEKLLNKQGNFNGYRTYEGAVELIDKSFPNGSRGSVELLWGNGSGHSITFEKTDEGKVVFRDAQNDVIYGQRDMQTLIDACSVGTAITFIRTDDLVIKEEALKNVQVRSDGEWYESDRVK